jgi:hypothetical protein
MRDIANLQLKLSITRALWNNLNHAQEPVSTRRATKRVVEILDAKYKKADIPAIIREYCSHLSATAREKLLSMLLRFGPLFGGTLGDWNSPPVSFAEIKDDMNAYHGRPYLILQIHKAVILLARKQIRKYTNHSCEDFFCSRVFFSVFDLCGIVLFGPECADARIFPTK